MSYYAKAERCENCSESDPIKNCGWLWCHVDSGKPPVTVVWSYTCEKWKVRKEAEKKK